MTHETLLNLKIDVKNILNLQEIGVNEIAFSKEDALYVLKRCKEENKAILGGDVYYLNNGRIVVTGDSWYYDNKEHCEAIKYAHKTIKYSIEYIKKYPQKIASEVYFSLIE